MSAEVTTGGERHPNVVVRAVVAFGRFWWDFLIGDTPELLVATLAVVGIALLFRHTRVLGVVLTLVAVVGFLMASVWHGRRK